MFVIILRLRFKLFELFFSVGKNFRFFASEPRNQFDEARYTFESWFEKSDVNVFKNKLCKLICEKLGKK
jgi:hypothetical protein